MLNNNYICALDIGASKIAAVVVKIKRKRITDIFFEATPSKGIKRGAIIDSAELTSAVGRALKNLKVKSGINIKFVYVNISGQDIITKHSHAIIPLAERGNKVVTLSDIQNVNEQARILGSSLEDEIIHQIPFGYSIDSRSNVLNPLGLYSHRLEVDLYLISGKASSVQTLTRVVNQAGYEIKDLFFSGIATSNAVFNKELQGGVNVLCDIGSDITEVLIYRNGMLKNIEILPIGGNDLTLQLSDELRIPFDLAEDVKRSYASIGDYSRINEDKEILVKKDTGYKAIKQRLVAEMITSKAKLICQTIRDAVENITPCNKIDDFIATGRTILIEGFLEMLENTLGTQVKLGRIVHPDIAPILNREDALSGQKYLTYVTSLGIVCQALHLEQPRFLSISQPPRNPILKAINKVKEVYQEYF